MHHVKVFSVYSIVDCCTSRELSTGQILVFLFLWPITGLIFCKLSFFTTHLLDVIKSWIRTVKKMSENNMPCTRYTAKQRR